MSWNLLIDESSLARLLSGDHSRFARPLKEGLIVFLEGLPQQRQADILAAQARMPLGATLSQRLGALATECPVLHKLGQVVARDPRIDIQLRRELHKLESLPPATPLEAIQQSLADEFGPLESAGIRLTPPAIAEASVAVVVPFVAISSGEEGVLKVLKPGIEDRLAEELALLGKVGAHLDEQCHRLGLPELDYQDAFEQVREKLSWEPRLNQEQRHLAAARRDFAQDPRVTVPRLLDYCTPRVTAMQRLHGVKITDHSYGSSAKTRSLARLVSKTFIASPVFSTNPQSMFHADPHAGNLMLTREGRLGVLDWSLVGFLNEDARQALMQVMIAAMCRRSGRVRGALEQLAEGQGADLEALDAVVREAMHDLSASLPSMKWLVALLDEAAQVARLRVASDLLLFRKALLTLDGVVSELDQTGQACESALMGEFLTRLVAEWPLRWLTPPLFRGFATRLSNADLAESALSAPWAVSQVLANRFSRRGTPAV